MFDIISRSTQGVNYYTGEMDSDWNDVNQLQPSIAEGFTQYDSKDSIEPYMEYLNVEENCVYNTITVEPVTENSTPTYTNLSLKMEQRDCVYEYWDDYVSGRPFYNNRSHFNYYNDAQCYTNINSGIDFIVSKPEEMSLSQDINYSPELIQNSEYSLDPPKHYRRKPGRKKGQISKVYHLWEFIRDLLKSPCYRDIIRWEDRDKGIFRVLKSAEVAKLWGQKKKNKLAMNYEKMSRSLRYSRKEGYFMEIPCDGSYPKKLCFRFGPKSHGWK
ncbi:ETS homologous factor isoform X1 [Octopus bimaculoides]|uniref:ETS domain-containing protein n=2 Tax=Octopus bimaculoides TaxID=37653 RepID=A0A0L8I057_OCTBM|nr:ETS homologous factor isoform X1 [Octopus bimaculoides]|eukprot:XP_014767921.1 PREDICTED: ETS homologous factor-like isoform X1 [Octopus bimaculoides]